MRERDAAAGDAGSERGGKMNWKKIFSETTNKDILSMIFCAEIALNIATNGKGKIVHPGAFLVFHEIIAEIARKSEWLNDACRNADKEMFAPESTEKKESEANE